MAQFDIELQKAIEKLEALKKVPYKERKKILNKAAKPFIDAAVIKAPKSRKKHYRYKNGEKITYYPGNLKRAIRKLNFRSSSVFVGPKLRKRVQSGEVFRDRKVDAYYAHMVEFGTTEAGAKPYMRPAFISGKGKATKIIEREMEKVFKKFIQENKA